MRPNSHGTIKELDPGMRCGWIGVELDADRDLGVQDQGRLSWDGWVGSREESLSSCSKGPFFMDFRSTDKYRGIFQ